MRIEFAGVTRGPTTINGQNVAVHVTVFGIGEEERGDGDLVNFSGATERHMGEHGLHGGVEHAAIAVKELPGAFREG